MEKDEANMLSSFINYSFESLELCSSRFVSSVEMSWSSNKLQGLVCATVFICGAMSPGTVQSVKGIRINVTERPYFH